MKTFEVVRKSDGVVVYSYGADEVTAWSDFPLALFDHNELPAPPAAPQPVVTVYGGRRELTHEEFRELFAAEEQWAIDAFEASFEGMQLDTETKNRIRSGLKSYYAATFVALDNPKVTLVLGVFAALGLIAVDRITEILNG